MRTLVEYRGSVYIRPLGRGIVLEDTEGERYLDEAIEAAVAPGNMASGWKGRLRILVEEVED